MMTFDRLDLSLLFPTVVTVITIILVSFVAMHMAVQKQRRLYDDWIQRARSERDGKTHKVLEEPCKCNLEEEEFLSAVETNNRVKALLRRLDPRENVIRLAHRTRKYGRKLSVVAEEFYDEAAQTAQNLNSFPNKDSPLFGVPISVKECHSLRGAYSTGGLACRLRKRCEKDCVMVSVLRQQGALPICTGNVPQIMMLPEAHNRIWGQGKNPWNLDRVPGGSSGGDAALVAMGCVPLAVGSDVAGSIRIPCSFCGVTGFRATKRRISTAGSMKPRVNDRSGTTELIPTSMGPIAKTVDDCAAFMKTILVPQMFEQDVSIAPMPFNDKAYQSQEKLRLAYFVSDGWFEPCRTSQRAVHETVQGLKKAGHDCIEIELPTNGWDAYCLLVAINGADGSFKAFADALEGEEIIDAYKPLVMATRLPDILRWVLVRLLDQRRSALLRQSRASGLSVRQFWEKTADLTELRAKWAETMKRFDAVIYPGMPIPAMKHGTSGELTGAVSYMFTASLLDWPTGAVPITTVRPDEACYPMEDLPESQRDHLAKLIQKTMEGSEGLPIGVSVMAPAYRDELCLRVMKEVERVVNFTATPDAYKTAVQK